MPRVELTRSVSKPIRPQILEDVLERWLLAKNGMSRETSRCTDELETVRDLFAADFAELAALYHRDSPPRLAAMRHACAEGNAEQLAKIAHAFSGSSASLGATGLSALCKELERQVKAGQMADVEQRLGEIDAEYRRVSDKLHTMINSTMSC